MIVRITKVINCIIGLLFLTSCEEFNTNNLEISSAQCQDDIDNYEEGSIDCADSECSGFTFCEILKLNSETINDANGTSTTDLEHESSFGNNEVFSLLVCKWCVPNDFEATSCNQDGVTAMRGVGA